MISICSEYIASSWKYRMVLETEHLVSFSLGIMDLLNAIINICLYFFIPNSNDYPFVVCDPCFLKAVCISSPSILNDYTFVVCDPLLF